MSQRKNFYSVGTGGGRGGKRGRGGTNFGNERFNNSGNGGYMSHFSSSGHGHNLRGGTSAQQEGFGGISSGNFHKDSSQLPKQHPKPSRPATTTNLDTQDETASSSEPRFLLENLEEDILLLNEKLVHSLCSHWLGTIVNVELKDGDRISGVFTSLNKDGDVAFVKCALFQSDGKITKKSHVAGNFDAIRTMTISNHIESEVHKEMTTDAEISARVVFPDGTCEEVTRTETVERSLVPYYTENDLPDDCEVDIDCLSKAKQGDCYFNAEEMFNVNEKKYGVKTTFNEEMHEYTVPINRNDPDYERKRRDAEVMAQQIEMEKGRRRHEVTSDDEEGEEKNARHGHHGSFRPHKKADDDNEEMRYAAVVRNSGTQSRNTPHSQHQSSTSTSSHFSSQSSTAGHSRRPGGGTMSDAFARSKLSTTSTSSATPGKGGAVGSGMRASTPSSRTGGSGGGTMNATSSLSTTTTSSTTNTTVSNVMPLFENLSLADYNTVALRKNGSMLTAPPSSAVPRYPVLVHHPHGMVLAPSNAPLNMNMGVGLGMGVMPMHVPVPVQIPMPLTMTMPSMEKMVMPTSMAHGMGFSVEKSEEIERVASSASNREKEKEVVDVNAANSGLNPDALEFVPRSWTQKTEPEVAPPTEEMSSSGLMQQEMSQVMEAVPYSMYSTAQATTFTMLPNGMYVMSPGQMGPPTLVATGGPIPSGGGVGPQFLQMTPQGVVPQPPHAFQGMAPYPGGFPVGTRLMAPMPSFAPPRAPPPMQSMIYNAPPQGPQMPPPQPAFLVPPNGVGTAVRPVTTQVCEGLQVGFLPQQQQPQQQQQLVPSESSTSVSSTAATVATSSPSQAPQLARQRSVPFTSNGTVLRPMTEPPMMPPPPPPPIQPNQSQHFVMMMPPGPLGVGPRGNFMYPGQPQLPPGFTLPPQQPPQQQLLSSMQYFPSLPNQAMQQPCMLPQMPSGAQFPVPLGLPGGYGYAMGQPPGVPPNMQQSMVMFYQAPPAGSSMYPQLQQMQQMPQMQIHSNTTTVSSLSMPPGNVLLPHNAVTSRPTNNSNSSHFTIPNAQLHAMN